MDKYKGVLITLIINIITVIITILATLLSISSLDYKTLRLLCIIIIVIMGSIGIVCYLLIAAGDYKAQVEKLNKLRNNYNLLQSIPHLMYFQKREDHFFVHDTGDGELHWDFYIVKETAERLSYLYFPICFERYDLIETNESEEFVTILETTFNGKNNEATYRRSQISTSSSGEKIETGYIEIPVLLDSDRKEFHLYIKLRIKNLFKNFTTREFILVDMAYITKELQVSITPAKGYTFHVPNPFFEAHEANAIDTDSGEIDKQMARCNINEKGLVWITQYPKLGYRYKISFSSNKQ